MKNSSVPCADEVKALSLEISNIIENWNGDQTFEVENVKGNNIKLPYGTIELDVEQGGWCLGYRVDVTWTVDYHRPDLELYRYDTCSSLEEALDWYKKQDLEASN